MKRKKESGFTLVELLIAVVIIAVLTAVALPAYQDFVKTSRRADARNALINVQVKQERYRSNNLSYGTLAQLTSSYGVSSASEAGHYSIAVTANTVYHLYRNGNTSGQPGRGRLRDLCNH